MSADWTAFLVAIVVFFAVGEAASTAT